MPTIREFCKGEARFKAIDIRLRLVDDADEPIPQDEAAAITCLLIRFVEEHYLVAKGSIAADGFELWTTGMSPEEVMDLLPPVGGYK